MRALILLLLAVSAEARTIQLSKAVTDGHALAVKLKQDFNLDLESACSTCTVQGAIMGDVIVIYDADDDRRKAASILKSTADAIKAEADAENDAVPAKK